MTTTARGQRTPGGGREARRSGSGSGSAAVGGGQFAYMASPLSVGACVGAEAVQAVSRSRGLWAGGSGRGREAGRRVGWTEGPRVGKPPRA